MNITASYRFQVTTSVRSWSGGKQNGFLRLVVEVIVDGSPSAAAVSSSAGVLSVPDTFNSVMVVN